MGDERQGRPGTGAMMLLGGLLAGVLVLGCGGGGSSSAPPPLSVRTAGPISLPVPGGTSATDITNYGYPQPYSGTLTVTLARDSSITGPVALAVSGLPKNVTAQFAEASTTGTSDELTIQAGYPDPTDPTFTAQLYPALGTYTLTITATSGSITASTPLTLNLVPETADFAFSFGTQDGSALADNTVVSVTGTTSTTLYTLLYSANSTSYSSSNSFSLGVQGLPNGLTAAYGTQDPTTFVIPLTITAAPGLAAGIYGFNLTATAGPTTHVQPVVIAYSPAPFFILPPFQEATPVTVAQGQKLTFPLYLGHNDATYFGTTEPQSGDPAYVGTTSLAASGVPAGMTVTFGDTAPTGLASVPLAIDAGTAAPGTYAITLQATRTGTEGTAPAPAYALPVTVAASAAAATTWIQAVEWGQSVLRPGLPLVGGKAALLRVQILADRSGVPAPAGLKATVGGVAYPLAGPATLPTTVVEGDLPTATANAGSSYTAVLPASAVQAGMTVTLSGGSLNAVLTPEVRTGLTFAMTPVPIVQQGLQPVLPSNQVIEQEMLAFWPLESVNPVPRAAYTTSIAVPLPPASGPDYSEDGWIELLSELASLRTVDKATSNYYGFFQLDFTNWKGTSSVVGLSMIGEGVGIGLDESANTIFQNDDPTLDFAGSIMVHEEGHAMNLNHAPAGGAGWPQLNYPYYNPTGGPSGQGPFTGQGAAIGSWGFDPLAMAAYDPTSYYDIMSYAQDTHWVSDWDYLAAMGWVGGNQGIAAAAANQRTVSPEVDNWVVSGWVTPAGEVHLKPLVRVACPARPPKPGAFQLRIRSTTGERVVPFGAAQVPDLSAGRRLFSFTVPAAGEVLSAEVGAEGVRSMRRASLMPLAARRAALSAAALEGSLVAREQSGSLHLEWDAAAHPWVNVIHEGSARTTLALHLTGGKADLSLAGLEAGGHFQIHYSDGLNAVVRVLER